ncbi:hypothetical protein D3C87_1835930 [compost metagenome]
MRQPHDSIGKFACVIDLVQVADHGDAELARGVVQITHHQPCGLRVQAGNGFVGQNHARPLRQRTRNAHALALAARQGVRAGLGLVRQVNTHQAFLRQCNVGAAE